jgi:hypothetical protein
MTERPRQSWVDGMNITIERRSVDGQPDSYAGLVQELVGLHVELVVTSSPWAPQMIKQASDTMPIVMAGGDADGLIRQGLVASLGRPSGTVTGLLFKTAPGLHDKRLQLLKEAPRGAAGRLSHRRSGISPSGVMGCNGELVNTWYKPGT